MTEVINEPVQEYDILQNEDNELLVAIRARLGGVKQPQILYDGQDKFLLYRNPEQSIFFHDVPEGVRAVLLEAQKLLMIEVHDDAVVREYMVPMRRVSKLPAVAA